MIRDYQALANTWFLRGKQRIVPTYGKHQGVKLLGILNYETGHIYVEDHESYDAQVFLGFLKSVLKQYPTGKVVMIVDNARIHHAKLIQPFLEEQKEHLELMFLPAYSPNLNLIEPFWKWLKNTVIYNVFYKHTYQIRKAVQEFVQYVNLDPNIVIDRLCIRM